MKRFGVGPSTIHLILNGGSWGHVPDGKGEVKKVGDQLWLFPDLRVGETGRWGTSTTLNSNAGSSRRLKDAGRAAGLKDLRFSTLRAFYRLHVAPGSNPDLPRDVAPPTPVPTCPVVLLGRSRKVAVNGRVIGPFSKGGYAVLKVLVKEWPGRVKKFDLEEQSGLFTTALYHLGVVIKFDEELGSLIELPGGKRRFGCRLKNQDELTQKNLIGTQ